MPPVIKVTNSFQNPQAGFVRILALPLAATEKSASPTFYLNPDPVAILEPPDLTAGSCCLAWDPMRDHAHMLVGYANGSVDLFTLKQRTLLVTEDDAFDVSKHIGNHALAVTAVQWQMIEERRIVISASLDPDVIIWDIDQGVILGKYRFVGGLRSSKHGSSIADSSACTASAEVHTGNMFRLISSRSMARDMKVLQFLPSIVVAFEESVSINPCVVVFESGAYKRAETTVRIFDINLFRNANSGVLSS